MRMRFVVALAVISVVLAACSTGGGGGGTDLYSAPDMGSAEALPPGTGDAVANFAEGLSLLQGAMAGSKNLITQNPSGGYAAAPKALPLSGWGKASSAAPKSFTTLNESGSLTLSAAVPNLTVNGTAEYAFVNWPTSQPQDGDLINGSMTITEKLTVAADHVPVSYLGADYVVSGNEICNIYLTIKGTGTYPDFTISGALRAGFGLACTVEDTMGGKSAKFILSAATDVSLSDQTIMQGNIPMTGTLYVYNAGTNELIAQQTISGADFSDLLFLAGM